MVIYWTLGVRNTEFNAIFYTYLIHLNPIFTELKKVNRSTSQQVNE